jgi:hypothetical protein
VTFVVEIGNVENFFTEEALLVWRESVLHKKLNLLVVWQALSLSKVMVSEMC